MESCKNFYMSSEKLLRDSSLFMGLMDDGPADRKAEGTINSFQMLQ